MSSELSGSEKSKKDSKKLDAIRHINQILSDAASDEQFQQDLQKPMVSRRLFYVKRF